MNTRRGPKPPDFKLIMLYFRAILWFAIGYAFIFYDKIRQLYFSDSELMNGPLRWIIGGLVMAYGIFRGYRAYVLSKEEQDEN